MQFFARNGVRAFLPAVALAFCHGGCGGGDAGSVAAAQAGSPASPTTVENRAPSISGDAAAYARVGAPYEFAPMAHDADGDSLTFSATNLPPWATLDKNSGRIAGTPATDDVGAYESIVISVADATHTAKTSAFEITVLSASTGVASLQWEIPGSKLDGSPLDNLAGYHILYGRSADDLDHSVFVEGSSVTTYEISALDPGIWYFAVAAVNANGLEGPPTTAAMKSI
ncbi:MAG: putative Ig domain-containing protein [Pseudomonadota bacterium]